jgi:hypothetical protein
MATTTTNYGFDIPQSTDLVKDGATAIATLGQDIDTAMNTALGTKKAGMVLLNTTSFSGVSAVSLPNNTFTSTYANYQFVVNTNFVNSTTLTFRMRLAGTDNSANSYVSQVTFGSGTSTTVTNTTSTVGSLTGNAGSSLTPVIFDVFEPFVAQRTLVISRFANLNMSIGASAIDHNVATAYDSMTIFTASGNMTGTVSVYGYNK